MMLRQRFLLNQQADVSVEPLEEMFESLVGIDELTWGLYEFTKELLRDKISLEDKKDIVCNSINCGKQWAMKMKESVVLGADAFDNVNRLAGILGLNIKEKEGGKPTKFRMVFAQFVARDTIEIIKEPIEKYVKLACQSEKLPTPEAVRSVLIAHEIFHFLEEIHQEEMYPHQKTIKLWQLFGYEHHSTVGAASEIAAMAFAKEFCEVTFVPQVLDVLLSYGVEVAFSESVYKAVMNGYSSHLSLSVR